MIALIPRPIPNADILDIASKGYAADESIIQNC